MQKLKTLAKNPLYVVIATTLAILCVLTVMYIATADSQPQDSTQPTVVTPEESDTPQPNERENNKPASTNQTNPSDTTPPKTTPTQQATQPSTQASKAGCKYYDDIPFKTIDKANPNLKEGQIKEGKGYKGSRLVCTDDKGRVVSEAITSEPIDKINHYGTFTYEQAQEKAKNICNTTLPAGTPRNSTFYWDCVAEELEKLW